MCTQQGFTVRPSLILKRQRCCMMGQALLRGRNLPRSVAHCWRPNPRRSKRLVTRVRPENLRISRQLRYMASYNGESLATSFSKVTTRTNSACDAPPPPPPNRQCVHNYRLRWLGFAEKRFEVANVDDSIVERNYSYNMGGNSVLEAWSSCST